MTDDSQDSITTLETEKVSRHELQAFDCPHCGAYARQQSGTTYWFDGEKPKGAKKPGFGESVPNIEHMEKLSGTAVRKCEACSCYSIFVGGNLVYPKEKAGPDAHEVMPDDVRRDFEEARLVVDDSPRAAAALLRLAIQRLVEEELDAEGGSLYQQIGYLVDEGRINPRIQKALDSVRVIGNNSVHPGEMDMDDDRETAGALFMLLNEIVDEAIARDERIDEVYEQLPDGALEGIENRDGE